MALAVVSGLVWAGLQSRLSLRSVLSHDQGRVEIVSDVTISSIVRAKGSTLSFRAVGNIAASGEPATRLDLRWYEFAQNARRPRPGEVWRLHLRLHAPRGSANPGRRYWEDDAFRHGIGASGYVRNGDNVYQRTRRGYGWIEQLRQQLSQKLYGHLRHYRSGPLIVALAVGDRQYLTEQHWEVLRRTGLSHLVAISGLHIGIVAGLAYRLGTVLGSAPVLRVSSQRSLLAGCLLSALMALAYAAMAGFTIPTRRALIVVFVFLLSSLSRRVTRPMHVLSIALLCIIVSDPRCVLDSGFWLSFTAVAVLLYSSGGQLFRSAIGDLWRMQFAILIGLMPLMIILFGQVSLAAPFINFVLLPVFGFFLVPAVLFGVLLQVVYESGGLALLRAVAWLLDVLWSVLVPVSDMALLIGKSGTPGTGAILLAVSGALLFLAPLQLSLRSLGLICLLPALFAAPATPAPGEFELTVLDVGQGLGVVVRTHRHVLIFDTGPKWRSGSDAAGRILLPFLEHSGIADVDRLVISHGDNDHAGGLQTLLQRFPDMTSLGSNVAGLDACLRGQRWFWDGVSFEVIHPQVGESWTGNNASCVVLVSNEQDCVLLTGDIEAEAEIALVGSLPDRLQCDLLVAPHHGSNTSSTHQFVRATHSRYVLVSASYLNQWGFPRPAVVRRWQRAGAVVLSTSTSGAISARVGREGDLVLRQDRCERRRFWRPDCAYHARQPD